MRKKRPPVGAWVKVFVCVYDNPKHLRVGQVSEHMSEQMGDGFSVRFSSSYYGRCTPSVWRLLTSEEVAMIELAR